MPEWTGRAATAFRDSLRTTNLRFARQLGVSERTVSSWVARPDTVPRADAREALDELFTSASPAVRARYEQIVGGEKPVSNVQALRIAVAVVLRDDQVLLVRRRDDASGIVWGFPSGVVKPSAQAEEVAVRETLAETGVHCCVVERIGSRLHPITGVMCEYFYCSYLAGEAANLDTEENSAVLLVPMNDVPKFIDPQAIYAPVLALLEDNRDAVR